MNWKTAALLLLPVSIVCAANAPVQGSADWKTIVKSESQNHRSRECSRHHPLLVQSDLYPNYPDHNYPLVCAETESERIAVVYGGGFPVITMPSGSIQNVYLKKERA